MMFPVENREIGKTSLMSFLKETGFCFRKKGRITIVARKNRRNAKVNGAKVCSKIFPTTLAVLQKNVAPKSAIRAMVAEDMDLIIAFGICQEPKLRYNFEYRRGRIVV